ncbi:GNAT family N-acetyltransferase [Nocardia nova]|uniref:GNAT family N-acetyltransferase n=1 Tax=Nocardia nova TaxID=37330 RepID=UPI001C67C8AB|nr:GNAT family N-acetyltransferase [Nocardia nova]
MHSADDRTVVPWKARLERHSRSWVGAFVGARLVGFVHAAWDGGSHAFLLDTAVAPDLRRQSIGSGLVNALVGDLRELGIEWLHVDYEPHLRSFYRDACGFGATDAGLLRLN